MTYLLSPSIESALAALAQDGLTVVAGATDYYPALGPDGTPGHILDVSLIDELRGIQREPNQWRIGATTTWTDIATAALPPAFAGLQAAATRIGGIQIQNVATVAGNLCNASPAADGVPPLLTLDASVEIRSESLTRVLPLTDFILGNRSTALAPGEMVTAVLVPDPAPELIGAFEKLGSRAYLVISIVMVAALAEIDDNGLIQSARVAVGACSEVAQRLTRLEADLVGMSLNNLGDGSFVTPTHLAALSPIDDVRASADYRLGVVPRLITRAIRATAEDHK